MNTYKSFLMQGTTSGSTTSWAKLIDIKDYPDLFSTPEALDKTTLSDRSRTYDLGIEETDVMEFTANYSLSDFTKIRALQDQELDLAVWFGGTENTDGTVAPTGSDGKFSFKGKVAASIVGKGVNEVREMKIAVAPTSAIVVDED